MSPLAVAPNEPSQRDDTILHGHRDVGRINVWVPPEPVFHV